MIAAIIGGGALLIVFILAMLLRDAEKRCADARVADQAKAGTIAIQAADLVTWRTKAEDERQRANDLDDILDEVATTGDATHARARVLQRWSRAASIDPGAAGGGDSSGWPSTTAAEAAGSSGDLLAPGE